ncbi:hypothetical protein LA080_015488 [Diaporthe eres]|nr:hypothetical protein LA080_015488 [Diaporthe eres]
MLVRPATKADIPGVASAAVAAYTDDPQDAYLYPKRNDYPARYLKVKSDIIKHSLDDPTASPVVAVLEPSDEGWKGIPEITAFCIWYREGPSGDEDAEEETPVLSSIVDSVRDLVNPIIDSSHAKAMANMCSSEESQQWNEDGYKKPDEYWGILDLGVDPKYQRRGIARSLLQWGLERAEKEGLPVHLSATPDGASLYRSLGFRGVGK